MTVADYSWWRQWRPEVADAHCVTLVGDFTAGGLLDALGADRVEQMGGIDALNLRTVDHWGGEYDPELMMVGAADIGAGWSLLAEINGFVGVTERLMGPVSIGRTIVSHFRNVNGVYRFHWWHDGRLLVDFDLLFPTERFGAVPDAVLDDLRGLGIPLDAEPESIADIDLSAAGFALAQRITGVACTPQLFEESDFLVGVVAMPPHEDQQQYGEALRATWSTPATW